MRHPIDGIRIPEVMVRLLEHFASDPESEWRDPWELAYRHASLLYDFAPAVLRARFEPDPEERPSDSDETSELAYQSTPFELVPISWNGGDGLHYDWVVHAPELDAEDFPMVSFAPGEDGAVWLGDSTAEGLAHLMVGKRKGMLEFGGEDPLASPMWSTLAGIVAIAFDPDDPRITMGARSEIPCVPEVPPRYRFEEGPDGVGVLAPIELFGDLDFEAMEGDQELFDREARRLMDEGMFAGALVLLKNLRDWNPSDREIVSRMRDAYLALGRPMHARRAELWLEQHA